MSTLMKKTIISLLNERFDVALVSVETAMCQPAELSMAKAKKGAREKKQIYRTYQLRSGRSGGRRSRRQKRGTTRVL